jgi:serine/threonine-protein kinase
MDTPHKPTPPPGVSDEPELTTLPDVELAAGSTSAELPAPPRKKHGPALPLTLGDFQVLARIGAGAMGAVYRARQMSKDRLVALKILKRHLAADPLFLQRFIREGEVMARLRHPNIVRCYKLGRQGEYYYLAMELAEGCTLGDWILKLGRLSAGDAVHVTLAVLRALQHTHQSGLIHRDVKPDNVLITRDGRIKLADMGLARPIFEEDLVNSQVGHGAGTPVYVAPEQARDARDADPRSDLYSLGCSLYRMLTGELPFRGEKSVDVIMAKVAGDYVPARRLVPDLPEELDDILNKLLRPDPDERYQSATDLLNELGRMQLASPVLTFLGASSRRDGPKDPDEEPRSLTEIDVPPTEGESAPAPEKRWYVRSATHHGDWVVRRYTTRQVLQALHDEDFVRTAEVSQYRSGFLPLAAVPEFRDALLRRDEEEQAGSGPHALAQPMPLSRKLMLLLAVLVGLASGIGFWLGQILSK